MPSFSPYSWGTHMLSYMETHQNSLANGDQLNPLCACCLDDERGADVLSMVCFFVCIFPILKHHGGFHLPVTSTEEIWGLCEIHFKQIK